MARWGVAIEKATLFRGVQQQFSNVYYYRAEGVVTLGDLDSLINAIVAIEKAQHTNADTFTRARLWTQEGDKTQNEMLIDKALSGTGALTEHAQIDKERAVLIQFRAGVDSRGRPVRLKKWFHLHGTAILGGAPSNGSLQNTAQLTQGQRDAGVTLGNSLKDVAVNAGALHFTLVAKNGREIDGATSTHPYYEHHQLGDAWRNA